MQEVSLGVSPSTWNVVKYIVLALIITPLLEALFAQLVATKATYDVLLGKEVIFSDSFLGTFGLHSTYWGAKRNLSLLLLTAILVIASELLFEFSFSSMPVDVPAERLVWEPPSFRERYDRSNSTLEQEPSIFPDKAIKVCTAGPSVMQPFFNRHIEGHNSHHQGGRGYKLSGIFTIRNPYLAEDNTTVLCGLTEAVGRATFIVPRDIAASNVTFNDGFNFTSEYLGFNSMSSFISAHNFTETRSVRLYGFSTEVWESERGVTCVLARNGSRYFCSLIQDNRFMIRAARRKNVYDRTIEIGMLGGIMEAKGVVVPRLRERGRQLRLLLYFAQKGLSLDIQDRDWLRLATMLDMEILAYAILLIAHEEGVSGITAKLVRRDVLDSKKQVATMSTLVIFPTAMLFAIMLMLLTADFILRILIVRKNYNGIGLNLRTIRKLFCHWRVSMSRQWLRAKLAEDLEQSGYYTKPVATNLGIKIVQKGKDQHLQVLPGIAVPRDNNQQLLRTDKAWRD